jgi:hypothetical protein
MAPKKRYRQEDSSLFFAPSTLRAVALAWVFPGAGHWVLQRKRQAVWLAVCLLFALVLGCFQQGDLFPFQGEGIFRSVGAFCQLGAGLPYFFSALFLERPNPLSETYEFGTTYFLIAGMVNWLAAVDAFDIAVKRK